MDSASKFPLIKNNRNKGIQDKQIGKAWNIFQAISERKGERKCCNTGIRSKIKFEALKGKRWSFYTDQKIQTMLNIYALSIIAWKKS